MPTERRQRGSFHIPLQLITQPAEPRECRELVTNVIARSQVRPGYWRRIVSGSLKRKLEKPEQRLARKNPRVRTGNPENPPPETERLHGCGLTLGNIGRSPTLENTGAEAALVAGHNMGGNLSSQVRRVWGILG